VQDYLVDKLLEKGKLVTAYKLLKSFNINRVNQIYIAEIRFKELELADLNEEQKDVLELLKNFRPKGQKEKRKKSGAGVEVGALENKEVAAKIPKAKKGGDNLPEVLNEKERIVRGVRMVYAEIIAKKIHVINPKFKEKEIIEFVVEEMEDRGGKLDLADVLVLKSIVSTFFKKNN
jgi:hypothetical protein